MVRSVSLRRLHTRRQPLQMVHGRRSRWPVLRQAIQQHRRWNRRLRLGQPGRSLGDGDKVEPISARIVIVMRNGPAGWAPPGPAGFGIRWRAYTFLRQCLRTRSVLHASTDRGMIDSDRNCISRRSPAMSPKENGRSIDDNEREREFR